MAKQKNQIFIMNANLSVRQPLKPHKQATAGNAMKTQIHDTTALSSWVEQVKWTPTGNNLGNIWFWPKKTKKAYVVPAQDYAVYLELIDPSNSPLNGTGTDMWEMGFLQGKGYRKGAPKQRPEIRNFRLSLLKQNASQRAKTNKRLGLWLKQFNRVLKTIL